MVDLRVKVLGLLFFCLLSLSALSAPVASADRGAIPLEPTSIYEAGQKAVVAWNGSREVLILSVDLKTVKEKTWALEVLPLPSMPAVEKGSEKAFQVLSDYFAAQKLPTGLKAEREKKLEILFHRQIGLHDVTVAKVGSAGKFASWLKDFTSSHGLPEPAPEGLEKAVRLIESYLARGYSYYAVDLVEVSGELGSVEPLVYSFNTDHAYFPLEISTLARGETSITIFLLTAGRPEISGGTLKKTRLSPLFENRIPRKLLGEADPRIASLFQGSAETWLTILSYKGDISRLRGDLVLNATVGTPVIPSEKWVPYTPSSKQVKLEVLEAEGEIRLKVSVVVPHGGFRVFWGEPARDGSFVRVEAKMERWTGPAIQVITTLTHTYNLGKLPPGGCTMVFKVNGQPVASVGYQLGGGKPAMLPLVVLAVVAAAAFALAGLNQGKRRFSLRRGAL